ncbi:MAG: hypothetical protein DWQ04_20215 [Chloroflexi bacterium]|nr:MAG: hypothetical protein DWQ04_20215 [Chloroflexota bacterium]
MKNSGSVLKIMIFVLMLLWLIRPFTAFAKQSEPVAINNIIYEVTSTESRELANGRVALIVVATGEGVIACQHNLTCFEAGLDGDIAELQQAFQVVVNTNRGQTAGRILIDVIGAGFKGSVRGTTSPLEAGMWRLDMTARARTQGGGKLNLELTGEFNKASGLIENLTGQGIITQQDIGQI